MSEVNCAAFDPLQQTELQDAPVNDLHLAQIAKDIKTWEVVAPFLGLSDAEKEEIRRDNKEYGVQKRKALQRWKQKNGSDATYRELRDALSHAEQAASTSSEWKQFHHYLIACCTESRHPSYEQRPTLQMSLYVDPSLVTTDGSNVKLSSVLRGEGRQVVLIEGPPGSGKTTLTWRTSQLWAEGKLYQQFSLLIPISLSTTGEETTCLADIIPYPSKNVRKKVADAITEKEGKGVCFLIDAWDEVPHSAKWQRSYLYNFLKGRLGYILPRCTILVTSRPAASSMLRTFATTKLRIAEFDSLQIEEFVDKSMDTGSANRFLEILEEKPELYALCHLPLNITIAVYLYKTSNQELPSTRTKLYKALVHTQLARHWQLRTLDGDVAMEVEISNVMEFLPQEMMTKFMAMCKLAYTGIMGGSSLFDQTAIKKAELDPIAQNTLSLMQSVKNISTSTKYSFLHYTIQEYLAAYHIAQLRPEQQREAVEKLLQISPLSTALPFYAGLTNLQIKEAVTVLLKVMEKPMDIFSLSEHLAQHVNEYGSDPRRLLVALMNSIYESEKHELYEHVQPQKSGRREASPAIKFDELYLTPSDCLSIGCFLRHTKIDVILTLYGCNISDIAFRMLVHQMQLYVKEQVPNFLQVYITNNPITHKGFECLRVGFGKKMLILSLNICLKTSQTQNKYVNTYKALAHLTKSLSQSSGLSGLSIGYSNITCEHKFHLLLLLVFSKSLQSLHLNGNILRGTMPLLAPALNHTHLKFLGLHNCCLDDNDIICLGKALQNTSSLVQLNITGNDVSPHAFSEFLLAIQYSTIAILKYDGHITVAHRVMLAAINNNRRASVYKEPLELHNIDRIYSMALQSSIHAASLPPEFRTGQKE